MNNTFVFPDYEKSLLNVPPTILSLFGIKTDKTALPKKYWENIKESKNIVMFLFDGFGFNIYDKIAKSMPFFEKFYTNGEIQKITSVFPATTTAAVTTIHTGLAPIEHGFFEWNLYFPQIEEIIESLPFRIVPTQYTNPQTILSQDPALIYDGETVYQKLKKNGVDSVFFIAEELVNSTYTKAISKGATIIGYTDIADLLTKLLFILQDSSSKLFCYVYWSKIDTAEHQYGVWSDETKKEVEILATCLEKSFIEKLPFETAKQTGVIFTADHGQEDIDLENPTLLNSYNFLTERYEKNSQGNPIVPSGSPRDMFLHVKEKNVDEVVSFLTKDLGDKSTVLKLDQKNIEKLFGTFTPHPEFIQRLGNILILSNTSHVSWYEYNIDKKLVLKANHGSLLESEMIIPFGSAKASDLR